MFTEPRHRRRLIPVVAILLALVIALPVALSRSQASSQTVSAVTPSISATEALSDRHTTVDPWAGMEEAIALHEQQVHEYLQAVAEAEAEQQRQAEAAAAAEAERQRQAAAQKAAAQKAAAAKQTTTTTAASKPAPSAAPAPAARSTSGNCGGWEGLIASHFSDVGTACRVMMCESEGNPRAQNPSGASGLFQVMPAWASRYQQVTGVPYYDGRFDPNANVRFAAYLVNAEGWASQFDCY